MNSMMRLVTNLTELRDGQGGIVVSIEAQPCKVRARRRRENGHNTAITDLDLLPGGSKGQEEEELEKNAGNEPSCVQRLMDLGLTPGTKVVVVKSAPFKGPLEVLVRGSRIVLGREVASRITIEVV